MGSRLQAIAALLFFLLIFLTLHRTYIKNTQSIWVIYLSSKASLCKSAAHSVRCLALFNLSTTITP